MSVNRAPSSIRTSLKNIASGTLDAVKSGSFILEDVPYDLSAPIQSSNQRIRYYTPDSLLSVWSSAELVNPTTSTNISILQTSTLEGARLLSSESPATSSRVGILNFASAMKPGGGFINGAQAQEESIARSSTLYPTLMTATAQQFYTLHNRDGKGGYYSHAMIYSPDVLVFRDDLGGWTPPLVVDVLTSAAVNAGVVRNTHGRVPAQAEAKIERVMRERMARILFLFEQQGTKSLVLGSFGTGVFRNDIGTVSKIWADLLVVDGARFKHSFDRIVFAIVDIRTFKTFKKSFEERGRGVRSTTS